MELREAKRDIEKLENDIEYYLNEKERLFCRTQPQAVKLDSERVNGHSERSNVALQYLISVDEKELDDKLLRAQDRKINIERWVENELRILGKYGEVERLIVYYKEEFLNKEGKCLTWREISSKVHYSESQCKKIYKNYKCMRNIHDEPI